MYNRAYNIPEVIKLLKNRSYTKDFAYREKDVISNILKIEYRYTINRAVIGGKDNLADIYDVESESSNAQFCIYHESGRQIDVTN